MASEEMAKPERTDDVVSTGTARRTLNRSSARVAALVLLALLAVLLGQRWIRWVYHVQRAASAMAAGLSWPSPRLVDSLPQQTGEAAAQRAMAHLQSARDLRPDHPFA